MVLPLFATPLVLLLLLFCPSAPPFGPVLDAPLLALVLLLHFAALPLVLVLLLLCPSAPSD